jgi:hypothetical protein
MSTSSIFRLRARRHASPVSAALAALALLASSLPAAAVGDNKTRRAPDAARPSAARTAAPDHPAGARARESFGRLPLSFEANAGQTDARVKFLARAGGYTLFLTPTEMVMSLRRDEVAAAEPAAAQLERADAPRPALKSAHGGVVRMSLVGANAAPEVAGEEELAGRVNYFNGAAAGGRRTGVARYGRVRYKSVYPGVDLVYYGNQRQLEYDFVVAPGGDPRRIELDFRGADRLEIDARGELVLHTPGGAVRQHKPFVYQEADGGRREVAGRYVRRGARRIAFEVGQYDASRPLVIDPVLSYSTYLGGAGFEMPYGIAADAAGNIYVFGQTVSTDFPVSDNALQKTKAGGNQPGFGVDVFVTKLRPAGRGAADLVYSTYLGGAGNEMAARMISDNAGNVYIIGGGTGGFPTTPNSYSQSFNGGFLTKLDPQGGLAYSTALPGAAFDIALAPGNQVVVTGATFVPDFPLSPNALIRTPPSKSTRGEPGGSYMIRMRLAGTGRDDLLYASYAHARRVAVDPAGNVTLSDAYSTGDLPTTANAVQATRAQNDICYQDDVYGDSPCSDVYIQQLRPTPGGGYEVAYGTWLGGRGLERVNDVATDPQGFIYATGTTRSTPATWIEGNSKSDDFPVTENAVQKKNNGNEDAFVVKIDPSSKTGGLSGLVYSTLLGGKGKDNPAGVVVGNDGSIYVAGETDSADFVITANVLQSKYGGDLGNTISKPGGDGFVAKINSSGSALAYSTYIGTTSGEGVTALAVDPSGDAYITGWTWSSEFPSTAGSFQPHLSTGGTNTGIDAFVSRITERRQPDTPAFAAGTGAFNVIDDAMSFVRQQYRDFLNREADDEGLRFWTDEITRCGADARCVEVKKVNVSAAFFLSIESRQSGYFFYRLSRATFGRAPLAEEHRAAMQVIGKGVVVNAPGWQARLDANRRAFVESFVTGDEFTSRFGGLDDAAYVDALFANTGVTPDPQERAALVEGLGSGAETRASVLTKVADNETLHQRELNPAFVLSQYFGYLQRDPDPVGYNFWLEKLEDHGGNYVEAEMVKSFLVSSEYRGRFGPE